MNGRLVLPPLAAAVSAGLIVAVNMTVGDSVPSRHQPLTVTAASRIVTQPTAPALAAATSAEEARIEATVAGAVEALQTIVVPPRAAIDHAALAGDLNSMQSAGVAKLAHFFAPGAAKKESARLANARAALSDPSFRSLGAGLSKISFTSISIHSNTAVVTAEATVWARMAQIHNGRAAVVQPSQTLIVTCTVAKAAPSAPWLVTTYDWQFAPGSAP